MRTNVLAAFLLLSLGCAGSSTPGDTMPKEQIAEPGDPTNVEEPAVEHPCQQEIALVCAEGSVDGCTVQDEAGAYLTSMHICVPTGETASTPCEQEIARVCDAGFVDACGLPEPAAETHVCVATPSQSDESVSSEGGETE